MSKEQSVTKLTAKLVGIRPIMFDRYAGNNTTKLKALDKMNLDAAGGVVLPVLNVFSMLTAQNTDSVASRFYGKQRRDVALGVNAFCAIAPHGIETEDIMDAPILDADGKQYMQDDPRITIQFHVARVKKAGAAIPNPKERPMIPTGWNVTFDLYLTGNDFVDSKLLQRMIEQGGILGLGTFRPIFGRYRVEWL
jgi:hypothetical protein